MYGILAIAASYGNGYSYKLFNCIFIVQNAYRILHTTRANVAADSLDSTRQGYIRVQKCIPSGPDNPF